MNIAELVRWHLVKKKLHCPFVPLKQQQQITPAGVHALKLQRQVLFGQGEKL